MKRYRLAYKDGSHGAWTSNYEYIKKMADFFSAEIEVEERV